MEHYSFWSLAKHALSGHRNWPQAWRSREPKSRYDVVIVGGGGQGLATAYYLAKNHGITNVAVLEKGWLGGGNTGRNTTAIRSNYFYRESTDFFDRSLQLYEGLSKELNYNVMLSQHGAVTLAHSPGQMDGLERWSNSIRLQGIDAEMLGVHQVKEFMPALDTSRSARFPIYGGFIQRRAGVARHDAVGWGYARGADALGVDIIQNCEVAGVRMAGNRVLGVETNRGSIEADKVVFAVAGHSTMLAKMAGITLPITSVALQAMVSEPIKPVLDGLVVSPLVHCYVSQSDRGEILIGGRADAYPSYGQRGTLPALEDTLSSALNLFPAFSRLKLMRQWAGIVDISPDTSPIIGKTPVTALYISTGWGTGGFKAIPVGGETLAYTVANDRPHPLIEPFGMERFQTGRFVNEAAAAGVDH
ncbi:sarcosine oxidase subunit beta family protein [Paraburkholderia phenoliruptrix]|uniref:sarcosine oxidase subunit beta family protein n=1 Tax=Paraburkholderia phenoliruptrix TaxID=252970 RepID=UPI002869E87D|nr:sarcosine oxidase subunit beta family protein [Paraburkholderia phenoliruptrix]WMY11071.1 sarcosine oxidase subunit beta family protein [Paraburkholderia phenoliruptrix]